MSGTVRQRLTDSLQSGAGASRAIATYMLANLSELPFETAMAVAEKVGVSELTVGRFCRSIGYQHFKDLKADLKVDVSDSPWLIGDRLREFQASTREGGGDLARSLELELAATVRVYELVRTPQWSAVVKRLATVNNVFIAGFQSERGIAATMAHLLQYVRDGVHLADHSSGIFSEVLLADPKASALVMFDARRYSRQAALLAQRSRDAGMPVTLVTDLFCDWAHDCTTEVFAVPSEINLFWDTNGPMLTLVHLMVNGIIGELGPEVEQRLDRMSGLYGDFVGHAGRKT
ncbi:MurR/RpiR family transcriptional regulator [Aminobacter aminovorans]|uniref:RpiR family transcriptional regulator n=1 Tax=Aminobacter aminovorans TaxID=83263 RepID=A0AAC8YJL1_AMIAI|nr:MurR/RpiR family transcriptional regulator [Aminobacter aminovorans]AMS39605.1 RpiR family transcriptional regulator [Aminobacter aminovorans]MBB3708284.1 DNA-binding MurR/RpiR family transcriptional regulator [Aminobacter aminovorans]